MRVSGSSADGLMAVAPVVFFVGLMLYASDGPAELLRWADGWIRHGAYVVYQFAATMLA